MIRITHLGGKQDTYPTGVKFKVNPSNSNLHISDTKDEDIAVHAHGTWASVSVDNSLKAFQPEAPAPEIPRATWVGHNT